MGRTNLYPNRKSTYIASLPLSANVAAARTVHWDLFNGTLGEVLLIRGIYLLPSLTAVVGIGLAWELIRTSSAGTGGSAITIRPLDTRNPALDALITLRAKPGGGAATNYVLQFINSSSEETSPYAGLSSILNHANSLNELFSWQTLAIGPGEGLKCDQVTNSAIGSSAWNIIFSLE